jgi:hypothetical protein
MNLIINRTVNINGSSKEDLRDQHEEVYEAILNLAVAMGRCAPHGRDFQINANPASDLSVAQQEHGRRMEMLEKLGAAYKADYFHLCREPGTVLQPPV